MNIRFGDGIGNENGTDSGEVEASDVRCEIGFALAPRGRRLLRLFSERNAVEGERFPSKIAVVSIELAGTKVRSIEKDLQASSGFDIGLAGRLFSGGLLPGLCRQDTA